MKENVKKALLWFLDLGVNIIIIFVLVLIIQKWLIAPFDVNGSSMCDTLNVINHECVNGYGEKIILNEATYFFNEPKRGDIIVFYPEDSSDKYFIKRIIGLPGETVEIKNGEVYITKKSEKKSEKLKEDYLNDENKGNTETFFSVSVFEVPENQYFVLGDNRKASTDSRSCFENTIDEACASHKEKVFVHRNLIRGKAWIVWWPLSNIGFIKAPDYQTINSESLEEK